MSDFTCVAVVVDKTTMFCHWETNKPGGATVHHSVSKHFEINGMLVDQHVKSTILLADICQIVLADICQITFENL